MLLLLALFALVPATHGCTVSAPTVTKSGASLAADGEVLVGEEIEITCTFTDGDTACANKKLQIGAAAEAEYSGPVNHTMTDVANLTLICTDGTSPEELVLTSVLCPDPAAETVTAQLSYDETNKKIKLMCNAAEGCDKAEVKVEGTVEDSTSSNNSVGLGNPEMDKYGATFTSTATIEFDNLEDAGYEGSCKYGAVEAVTATFCPKDPEINLGDGTVTATGMAFTVTCNFNNCEHTKFKEGNVEKPYNSSTGYVVANGVLTETEYTCVNGDDKMTTKKVGCLDGMTVLNNVGGVCKTTLTPMICKKLDNGTYVKTCEEDTTNQDSQCRCPKSTPWYHEDEGECKEKCGAQGIFVSIVLVIAAALRFL